MITQYHDEAIYEYSTNCFWDWLGNLCLYPYAYLFLLTINWSLLWYFWCRYYLLLLSHLRTLQCQTKVNQHIRMSQLGFLVYCSKL